MGPVTTELLGGTAVILTVAAALVVLALPGWTPSGLAGRTHQRAAPTSQPHPTPATGPAVPTIAGRAISATRVTFTLTGAVHLDGRPVGPGASTVRQPETTVLTLGRGMTSRRVTVTVVGRSGKRARLTLTAPALAEAGRYDFGPATGRRIYLTVDDGWTPSPQVLALVKRMHLPLTVFLIKEAALRHPAYWRSLAAAGSAIEDETVSGARLTTLSLQQARQQWAGARTAFSSWYGTTPLLGRAPYGAVDPRVRAAAALAGLHALLGWSAMVSPARSGSPALHTYDHRPLRAGEIVLLRWDKGLYPELTALLATIKSERLVPALLSPGMFPSPSAPAPSGR